MLIFGGKIQINLRSLLITSKTVKWDFLSDFQTLCHYVKTILDFW